MKALLIREQEGGFAVAGLRSAEAEVRIVPRLGARILSLKDLRTGREWMDRPLGPALFANAPGEDFTKGTFAGADECLPTIGACRLGDRDLPDHGEVWSLPWTLDAEALEHALLETTVTLTRSPFLFRRSLSLDIDTVTLDYSLTNTGEANEPFLWAIHPLLAIRPGDRLVLPEDVRSVTVESVSGMPGVAPGDSLPWPNPDAGIALDRIDLGGEACAKVFAGPLGRGVARLQGEDGSAVEFAWDHRELPWLGIWITRGAFRGFHHVALEPSNAACDGLAEAVSRGGNAPVAPGETKRWSLRLRLLGPGNAP